MLYYVISSIFCDVIRGTVDVCRPFGEQVKRTSNGLFSNNEGEMYTTEEKSDSNEDEEYDFSLFAALEMGPYPSNTPRQMTNWG